MSAHHILFVLEKEKGKERRKDRNSPLSIYHDLKGKEEEEEKKREKGAKLDQKQLNGFSIRRVSFQY